jgi:hypothetical protein
MTIRHWKRTGAMSLAQRIECVAETTSSLPKRAIAAWYASGVEWGKERRIGHGDLGALMDAFRDLGVPSRLVSATHAAATRTREPIVVMTRLIWLASEKLPDIQATACAPASRRARPEPASQRSRSGSR